MSKNAKSTKNISIDPKKHAKVLDIFDQWDKQGLNHSGEICKAIKMYHAHKELGNKIDQYIEPNPELMKMPRINQELKSEDIDVLCHVMTRDEFHTLMRIMERNYKKMLEFAFHSPTTPAFRIPDRQ